MAFFQGLLSKLITAIGTTKPTLPLGEYSATPPTLSDGEAVNLQVNSAGELLVDSGLSAAGALATEATLATRASEATALLIEDAVQYASGQTEQPFIDCRAFSGTTTESAVEPPAAGWVTVSPQLGAIEFLIKPAFTFGGTPTQVRFRYWGRTSGGTPEVFKIWEEVLDASQLELSGQSNALLTRRFNSQVDQVYVTVTFLDGTSPTITGNIDVRPISLQTRDNTIYKRDISTGNPISQSPAYDSLLGADKAARVNDLYPAQDDPLVVSEASRATGTHYAPSSSGIDMGTGYKRLTIRFAFAAAGTSSVVNDIEASIDGTNWDVVTLSCVDAETGLSPTATSLDSSAGGAIAKAVLVKDADHFKYFRLASTVTNGPTGAHTVSFRRASDKS